MSDRQLEPTRRCGTPMVEPEVCACGHDKTWHVSDRGGIGMACADRRCGCLHYWGGTRTGTSQECEGTGGTPGRRTR